MHVLYYASAVCFSWIFALFVFCQLLVVYAKSTKHEMVLGFFHPNCTAGGGGERVLWCALRTLKKVDRKIRIVIYSAGVIKDTKVVMDRVWERFKIDLRDLNVEFVPLSSHRLLQASQYRAFTLLGQSMGSVIVGFEAMFRCIPHVYLDTTGYAFTMPVAKYFFNAKVAAYVHYPTISLDMIQAVQSRKSSFNNVQSVANSVWKSKCKLLYYRAFACFYGIVGSTSCDCIMVNSSWTKGHIAPLWKCKDRVVVVYPPCDTMRLFEKCAKTSNVRRKPYIVSIAQFRPEKNHTLQIHAFYDYTLSPNSDPTMQLILIGGSRNSEDASRVEALKQLCEQLGITSRVKFVINASYAVLFEYLTCSTIGIHTMDREHFGIGVVEMMAAGVLTIAHDSGGPQQDIIQHDISPPRGFLATTRLEYASKIRQAASLGASYQKVIRENASISSQRFSDDVFEASFADCLFPLLDAL